MNFELTKNRGDLLPVQRSCVHVNMQGRELGNEANVHSQLLTHGRLSEEDYLLSQLSQLLLCLS